MARVNVPIPEVSAELIAWLEAIHPVLCIGPHETEAQAQRRAGIQDCIALLRFHHMRQTDSVLTDDEKEALGDTYDEPEPGFVNLGRTR